MYTKATKIVPLLDYKIEINIRFSKNLQYLMEQSGYGQNYLREVFRQHGIDINQGTINKYLNKPTSNFIPIAILIKCSEIFNIPIEKLVMEDLTANSYINTKENSAKCSYLPKFSSPKDAQDDTELIVDANNRAFKGYFGTYYCYLFPTLSSETEALSGEFSIKNYNSICKVTLKLNTNKLLPESNEYIYKEYEGEIILSKPLRNCYCILKSNKLSELCFLTFRHIYLNHSRLDCRMAEVLTVSAGESHYPTVHRMFFSREPLSSQDLKLLLPHLCLNSSDIIISKSEMDALHNTGNIPLEVLEQISHTCEPELFYLFKEDYFRSILEHTLSKNDKKKIQQYLSLIREKSLSYHFNKVSKKLDTNIRRLLISLGHYSDSKK